MSNTNNTPVETSTPKTMDEVMARIAASKGITAEDMAQAGKKETTFEYKYNALDEDLLAEFMESGIDNEWAYANSVVNGSQEAMSKKDIEHEFGKESATKVTSIAMKIINVREWAFSNYQDNDDAQAIIDDFFGETRKAKRMKAKLDA